MVSAIALISGPGLRSRLAGVRTIKRFKRTRWKTPPPPVISNDASSCASACAATSPSRRRSTRAARFTSSRIPSACATTASRTTSISCSSSSTAAHARGRPEGLREAAIRPDRLKLEDLEAFAQQLITAAWPRTNRPRRQAALRTPQEATPQRMDADAHQHPLHQDPRSSIRIGCSSACSAGSAGSSRSGSSLLSVGLMLAAIVLVGDALRHVPCKLPDYHEFFSFKTVVYLWVGSGRGQGHPRVRPRPQLQGVRRRSPRDGLSVAVPVAGPVLQRLRRLDAAEQMAPHHHQLRPASTSS